MDVATLAELLHETAQHHDAFEKRAPKHDWWDWYAPYPAARAEARPKTCHVRPTGTWPRFITSSPLERMARARLAERRRDQVTTEAVT